MEVSRSLSLKSSDIGRVSVMFPSASTIVSVNVPSRNPDWLLSCHRTSVPGAVPDTFTS